MLHGNLNLDGAAHNYLVLLLSAVPSSKGVTGDWIEGIVKFRLFTSMSGENLLLT